MYLDFLISQIGERAEKKNKVDHFRVYSSFKMAVTLVAISIPPKLTSVWFWGFIIVLDTLFSLPSPFLTNFQPWFMSPKAHVYGMYKLPVTCLLVQLSKIDEGEREGWGWDICSLSSLPSRQSSPQLQEFAQGSGNIRSSWLFRPRHSTCFLL